MQPKNIRRKTIQEDSDLLKRNQMQKTKEDKKFSSNTDTPQVEYPLNPTKIIDKDYLRMIRNKKEDFDQYEPDSHAEIGNSKIFVVVRKRPLSKKEQMNGEIDNISVINPRVTVHECKIKVDGITKYLEDHQFYFDNTFGENETTQEIYDYTVGPMIEMVLNKGIVTCFAYGQTGSGKTYTMKGIQNLAIDNIFEECKNIYGQDNNLSFYISFFEIYGGRLYDLLNNKNKLQVLDDQNGKTQIYGLQEMLAETPDEMRMIIDKGNSVRTTHNTVTNATSSRSHAICNIIIKEKNKKKNNYNFFGKLSLVDLAGSERAQETQSNNRLRRAEGAEINKSLLALKECIRALQARKSSGNSEIHVPFRASKLTHVLRDSFVSKNDKSKIIMISCINPSYISSNHTINTLRYSDRLKEQTAYMQKLIAKNKNINNNNHHQVSNNQNNNKKDYNNAQKAKRDREKELEEINLNVFNSKDDILNDINFDDKINLAEDILGFHNDIKLNIDMNNLADELIDDNFISNKKNNNSKNKKTKKDNKSNNNNNISGNDKKNQKNENSGDSNNKEDDEILDLSKKDEENEKNKNNKNSEEENVKENSELELDVKDGDEKEKIINEELEDLIYLKKKVSKDGKFISDDFIKYHKLTDQIIEDEDDIVATHMDVIKQDAKMLTEEGELITKIKGIEYSEENFSMEEYLKRLEKIIDKKIDIYSGLQNKIDVYKQHIKDEEKMRKEHPQLFVDPADY
jgi:kinesin family protein 2/24